MSKWLVLSTYEQVARHIHIWASGSSSGSSYMNEQVARHIHIYEPLDEPLAHMWLVISRYDQVARQVARICGCDEPRAHSYMTSQMTSHYIWRAAWRATCSFIFHVHHIWRVTYMASHVDFRRAGDGMSRVMNKLHRTYTWVTSYVHMSHIARINESHCTYKWVMLQIMWWTSYIAHVNESHRTYKW